MTALPPPDPLALAGELASAIDAALGTEDATKPKTLRAILVRRIEERAAKMSAPTSLDPKALAKLVEEMGADLDQLEDLLEALALTARPARGG